MSGGRVRRKVGLAQADALAAPAAAVPRCALCDRPLGRAVERHHLVPRSEGGIDTVALHPVCHRAIHAAAPNVELAQRLSTVVALRAEPGIARFLRWIAKKDSDFHVPTRSRRR